MKSKILSLFFLLYIPVATFSQEVIMSGDGLYRTNFSLINGSIMDAAIKSKGGAKKGTTAIQLGMDMKAVHLTSNGFIKR